MFIGIRSLILFLVMDLIALMPPGKHDFELLKKVILPDVSVPERFLGDESQAQMVQRSGDLPLLGFLFIFVLWIYFFGKSLHVLLITEVG